MKISIISPAYNVGNVIDRTIESVRTQTYDTFELIIVDDGSTDDTATRILQVSDSRIRLIRFESNRGVHAARNAGIEAASGDYIMFLDADDELYPECLSVFASTAKEHEDAGIISCPYVTNCGERTGLKFDVSQYVRYEDLLCLKHSRRLKPGLAMVKRELAKQYSFPAPNVDFIFYRYVMRAAPLYYIAEPLAQYNLSDSEIALHIARRKPNITKSIMRARALDTFLDDFTSDYLDHCPRLLADYAYGAAIGLLLDWQISRALHRAFQASRYSKWKAKYVFLLIACLCPISPFFLQILFRWGIRI